MSRLIIYPYKLASASAKKIAETLDVLRVRPDGRYRYRAGDLIVNWGNSHMPNWWTPQAAENILNKPEAVRRASNKIETFQTLAEAEVPTLDFTIDQTLAQRWTDDGDVVYVRSVVNGHSGAGITVLKNMGSDHEDELIEIADQLNLMGYDYLAAQALEEAESLENRTRVIVPAAPLYTKGVENHGEYRVHVFKGEVIDYRKKSRRDGEPALDGQSEIRTLGNGWVFRQSNLRRLERVEELAVQAIEALGLDFGAVDIIKDEEGNVRVVEVNTAVACDDETLTNYVTAINNFYESRE